MKCAYDCTCCTAFEKKLEKKGDKKMNDAVDDSDEMTVPTITPIPKDLFCEVLNKLKALNEFSDKTCNETNKFADEADIYPEDLYTYRGIPVIIESYLIELLCYGFSKVTPDEAKDMIEWWCYDLEFGTRFEDGDYKVDNKNVSVRTPEELYDILNYSSNKSK